jgi:hypothetical protein
LTPPKLIVAMFSRFPAVANGMIPPPILYLSRC